MADTLHDFINRRRHELHMDRSIVRGRLEQIEAELNQLAKAAEAAGVTLEPLKDDELKDLAQELGKAIRHHYVQRTVSEKTIKEAVMEVLSETNEGMTAVEILDAINKRFRMNYPRTSLSPQLSRLKQEDKIVLEGRVWKAVNARHKPTEAEGFFRRI
jgi:ribosomal protein S6